MKADFSDDDLLSYLKEIQRYKPRIISGYPIYLYLLAKYIRLNEIQLPPCKVIDLTSGLSTRGMRGFIGEQFKAPVHQIYGGCELGRVASGCTQSDGLMHILEDHCFIEFLRDSGEPAQAGELSNIIVTSLTSYGMPFIRYEHGDVGKFYNDPCDCGRTTQLMDVEGRLQDLIITQKGEAMPSQRIMETFLELSGIRLFQLIQHDPIKFEFRIAKEDPDANVDISWIKKKIMNCLGSDIEVDFKYVDFIKPAASGKYRLVRSTTYKHFRCVEDREQPLGNFW